MATTKKKSRAKKNAKIVLVPATATEILAAYKITPREIKRVDTILRAMKIIPAQKAGRASK
jgi:hypothetical protein